MYQSRSETKANAEQQASSNTVVLTDLHDKVKNLWSCLQMQLWTAILGLLAYHMTDINYQLIKTEPVTKTENR